MACQSSGKAATHWEFCKAWVICSPTKSVFLKLQQLDDQPRQRLAGGSISLHILERGEKTKYYKFILFLKLHNNLQPQQKVTRIAKRPITLRMFRSFPYNSLCYSLFWFAHLNSLKH